MKVLLIVAATLIAFPAAAQPRTEQASPPQSQTDEARARNNATAKDAALTGKVKSALAADVGLKTLKINVDSVASTGTVTLKGRVDTDDTRRRAEEVAKKVGGVKAVKNELQVGKG